MADRPESRLARLPPEARLRLAALAVAVAGLAAAGVQWLPSPETADQAVNLSRTRAAEIQLERIGGKFAVMASQLDTWFEGLWAGRPLAGTIAVLEIGRAHV